MTRPSSLRWWVAGLLEHTAALIQHLGAGLDLLADTLDPRPDTTTDEPAQPKQQPEQAAWTVIVDGDHVHTIPNRDAVEHTLTDDCPCGPTARCSMTGRGDVWHIRHHRLREDQ